MAVTLSGNTYAESDFSDYGFRSPRADYNQVVRPMWEAMWVDGLNQIAQSVGGLSTALTGSTNLTLTPSAVTVGNSITAFVGTARAFAAGMIVQFYAVSTPAAYVTGEVTAYSGTSGELTMTVLEKSTHSTSFNNWKVTITGRSGPAGPQGAAGPSGAGSSVVTQNNGSNLGTATTINFVGFTAAFAGSTTTITLDLSGRALADLSNVSNANFAAKAVAAGVGTGSGGGVDFSFIEAMFGGGW